MAQFEKGRSGNPGGRPKGIERVLREQIAACRTASKDGVELDGWAAIARRLFETATGLNVDAKASDEVQAARLLYERVYGKPKATVEITEAPVEADVDWAKVPIEDRRRLLAAMDEISQLAEATSGDSDG